MAEMRAIVLQDAVLYGADGAPTCVLAQQDLVAVRVTLETPGTNPPLTEGGVITLLIVDRALLERGGVVRVGG